MQRACFAVIVSVCVVRVTFYTVFGIYALGIEKYTMNEVGGAAEVPLRWLSQPQKERDAACHVAGRVYPYAHSV